MGRRWLIRKGNYILKSNLPIGVQNMTLKSIELGVVAIDFLFQVLIIFSEIPLEIRVWWNYWEKNWLATQLFFNESWVLGK